MIKEINYKGETFRILDNGDVGWSYNQVAMPCAFGDIDSAKYLIDNKKRIAEVDNFYTACGDMQKVAISENNGSVTKEIIENYIKTQCHTKF